ncbi:MAG TPA: farnesyl-diphosphate synthase [Halieaceae bacterium]|nr:farnesyl-diphosphate synthase [Halieaceae bacterium]
MMEQSRARCEARLQALSHIQPQDARASDALAGLEDAVRYALQAGGKRIRPCLVYAAAQAAGNGNTDVAALDDAACAMELVHTYSLIHDDLPAMDNDDLRRGRPTLHKAFDEATAILVGDGLQALAFQLLASANGLSAEARLQMVTVMAQAAGLGGMVGGQFVDIAATGSPLALVELQGLHALKTGALIRASLSLGGIAAGAPDADQAALEAFGAHLGLAFQVVDDILDVEGSAATLGKTGGKDAAAGKTTYVSLLGLEGARSAADALLADGLEALECFGDNANPLRDLARYIVQRQA